MSGSELPSEQAKSTSATEQTEMAKKLEKEWVAVKVRVIQYSSGRDPRFHYEAFVQKDFHRVSWTEAEVRADILAMREIVKCLEYEHAFKAGPWC